MKSKSIFLMLLWLMFGLACSSAIVPCVPNPETCNGQDDDCDGVIDNNLTDLSPDPCGPPTTGICLSGQEACVNGEKVCEGAVWPGTEVCNNLDDDCDGQTDEELANCGCSGGKKPTAEACNGIDDDCNGVIDDLTSCACAGGAAPTAEICNGIDDDCDGSIDEDFPPSGQPCDGPDSDQCKNGTFTCTADGTGIECINETIVDIPETCNGQDDDCNGIIDDLPNCACTGGAAPTDEICNGIDDDCDGSIDEDFPLAGQPCDGPDSDQCKNGTFTCTADGTGVECVNETIQDIPETCNQQDDDCNGIIDDLPNCACTGGVAPKDEICNGMDDDCDGQIDESNGYNGSCAAFGEPCQAQRDCSSQLCSGDDYELYCSQRCDPNSSGSCPDGYRCIVGSNVDYCRRNYLACTADAQCPSPQVCTVQDADDGLSKITECRPPLSNGGSPGAACSDFSDCANDLCSIGVGICYQVCGPATPCADTYLGKPTVCNWSGYWVTPGDCSRDEQCPTDYHCRTNSCYHTGCASDCETGYACDTVNDECVPDPLISYVGACVIACEGDFDCPNNLVCQVGVLATADPADGRIQGQCDVLYTNCGGGQACNPTGQACPCDHGICVGNTYCSQVCGDATDCPLTWSCSDVFLTVGDLGALPAKICIRP